MKRVWIDCGHGGHDSGAVGPGGTKESGVVLSVGMLLKARLVAGGFEVGMSRISDKFIPLLERTWKANDWGADLVVSIHCNSYTKPTMGIETFIARRTQVSFPAGESMQDALVAEFPGHTDRGLKRADFVVLKSTNMAAVLVELEFLHTLCGEAHLKSPKIQARYAKALEFGVLDFFGIQGSEERPGLPADPDEPVACKAMVMAEQLGGVITQLERIKELA